MQTGVATVENCMEFPQKTKNGTAFWPSNSSAGSIPWEYWNTNSKETMNPCVHSSIIYNSEDLEAAQMLINKWVDKTAMVYLHNEILYCHKKQRNPTFSDSIDGTGDYYVKWNKPVRER